MRLTALARLACLLILAIASQSLASTMQFQTSDLAACDGKSVDAQVMYVTSNNLITVFLSNNQMDPDCTVQNITGIHFTLSDQLTHATLVSSSDCDRIVHTNGTWHDTASSDTGWQLYNDGGMFFDLRTPTDRQTLDSLIGQPASSNDCYTDDAGQTEGPGAEFTIYCPGVTTDTTITSSSFTFGDGNHVSSTGSIGFTAVVIPEPCGLALVAAGAVFLRRLRGRRI